MKRIGRTLFICICCIFTAFFIAGCNKEEDAPNFSFEQSIISLTKGDIFDLSNNDINIGEVVDYSCDSTCVKIEENNLIAKDCGCATISATITYNNKNYYQSFQIDVQDFSSDFYFKSSSSKLHQLNLAIGCDYVIDVENSTPLTKIEYSLSNNNVSFNTNTRTLTPASAGNCILSAKLSKNEVELKTTALDISISEPLSALSVISTDTSCVELDTFYSNTEACGLFKVAGITESNLSKLSYQAEEISLNLDNISFISGFALIPFQTQSFGTLEYSFSYANDFDNIKNTKTFSDSINCYQFVKGINFNTSITANLDNSYSVFIAHGSALQRSTAQNDEYNISVPFSVESTNAYTSSTFDISANNENVSIIDNIIYPVNIGTSLITITAQDGSNISVQILIKVIDIVAQDIISSYEETTTVYLASDDSYTILLSNFSLTPVYCEQSIEFMLDGTPYTTDIEITEVGEYSLVVTSGTLEEVFMFNIYKRPDSIALYEASSSKYNSISFRFTYGLSYFLSSDITVKYSNNDNWISIPESLITIEGNSIRVNSSINNIRICWSIDESIFTDYSF